MGTIGIHPSFTAKQWAYPLRVFLWSQHLQGYSAVTGRYLHLIPPGKTAKVKQAHASSPKPFNGGGAAA